MSTRSIIQVDDKAVYCHWDGSPDHVGVILNRYYTEKETASELVSHGAISVIGAGLGTRMPFEQYGLKDDDLGKIKHNKDGIYEQCLFYTRDRGDDYWVIDPETLGTHIDDWPGTEYLYIHNAETKQWDCFNILTNYERRTAWRTPAEIPHWREDETCLEFRKRLHAEQQAAEEMQRAAEEAQDAEDAKKNLRQRLTEEMQKQDCKELLKKQTTRLANRKRTFCNSQVTHRLDFLSWMIDAGEATEAEIKEAKGLLILRAGLKETGNWSQFWQTDLIRETHLANYVEDFYKRLFAPKKGDTWNADEVVTMNVDVEKAVAWYKENMVSPVIFPEVITRKNGSVEHREVTYYLHTRGARA